VLPETSSKSLIHLYGRRVPVEQFPSHSVTVLRDGDLRKMNHEGFADSLVSELGPDEKIFQEKPLPSLLCGVVVEKEGHSGRLAIRLSNNYSELGIR